MAFGSLLGSLFVTGVTTTNPTVAAGTVAVSIGNLIVAVCGEQTDSTANGCTDNLGNSYTQQNGGSNPGSSVSGKTYYSRATVAGSLTAVNVSSNATSANRRTIVAGVWEGAFLIPPIDANTANKTSDTTSPFSCTATPTLLQSDELIVNWCVTSGSNSISATSPNLLVLSKGTNNPVVALGYQVVSDTTPVTAEFTAGANPPQCILGTMSFKRAPNPQPLFLRQALVRASYW